MAASEREIVHEAPGIGRLILAARGLVFEVRSEDTTTIYVIEDGVARRVAKVEGRLVDVVDDAAFVIADDGTLGSVHLGDASVNTVATLAPIPKAIAVDRTGMVWCSADTRGLTGRIAHRVAGEVWRWRFGPYEPERIGTQESFTPMLAVSANGVWIAADASLGVVDDDGLEWLVDEDQPIKALAPSRIGIAYAVNGRFVHRPLAAPASSLIWRCDIPLALAVSPDDQRCAMARNRSIDRGQTAEESALAIADLGGGAPVSLVAEQLSRPVAMVADGERIYIVEQAWNWGETDRLTAFAWDRPALSVVPANATRWNQVLSITWTRRGGGAGNTVRFAIEPDGRWLIDAGAIKNGKIDTLLLAQELMWWTEHSRAVANGWVSAGSAITVTASHAGHAWHFERDEIRPLPPTEPQEAVEELLRILVHHVPALEGQPHFLAPS
jgi:hypothetical protein